MNRIVLVGAGLAAQRCCQSLRRLGHDGPITLVGDESVLPYDRPPLSKEHLHGEVGLELRSREWYERNGIELRLGDPAVGLDVVRRRVPLASGDELPYDRALVATGARPVRLPGLESAHVLRSAADAADLRGALGPGARLAVVGGGFVGLEVAATARALGVDVTLFEAAPVPLFGVVGARLGSYFADWHASEGVDVVTGATALPDAAEYDAVLVAVGVRPALDWLPGRAIPDDPHVFAAGDAAGGHHWEAAVAAGTAAAHAMLGRPAPASRCRASGATSTASASSSPATPAATTSSSSTATPPRATSPPSSCATASSAAACSSGARAPCPRSGSSSTRPPSRR